MAVTAIRHAGPNGEHQSITDIRIDGKLVAKLYFYKNVYDAAASGDTDDVDAHISTTLSAQAYHSNDTIGD